MSDEPSLGLISLNDRTIAHDLTLLERYLEFSAELLRLSLLGMSALAYWASKVIFVESTSKFIPLGLGQKLLLSTAVVGLSISAAAALFHRYMATDSMSWHLQAMRRYTRNRKSDAGGGRADKQVADSEQQQRLKQFRRSELGLAWSAAALCIGAISFAIAALSALI